MLRRKMFRRKVISRLVPSEEIRLGTIHTWSFEIFGQIVENVEAGQAKDYAVDFCIMLF